MATYRHIYKAEQLLNLHFCITILVLTILLLFRDISEDFYNQSIESVDPFAFFIIGNDHFILNILNI